MACAKVNVDIDEDQVEQQLGQLVSVFPETDPEYLHRKVLEFVGKDAEFARWIDETLENGVADLPTRKDYESRLKEAEELEKYSSQVTVREILEMYNNDPESFFMDKSRTVSDVYKQLALFHLKREFRFMRVSAINKIFAENDDLFLPSYRALQTHRGPGAKRKTMRKSDELTMPTDTDIDFLKELQYARKEAEVRLHLEEISNNRNEKIESARKNKSFRECECCGNDECIDDDMLPCSNGHLYCKECIQRASEVAIGDGKTELRCLIHCNSNFDLSTLQKALGSNTFSKWMKKIQLAEVEKAGLDDLEQCPFCPFATIMEVPKETNKVFRCLNPECGKDSCRLCGQLSHIPMRCEEMENDDVVRKRTYIENKMAEALIRHCYNCQRPYIKLDGCNKITCSNCGKLMCYLCRQPVTGYDHFAGQGMEHLTDKCPLWSDNNHIHRRDVALGGLAAKTEMDEKQPGVALTHDPTAGLDIEQIQADEAKAAREAAERRAQGIAPGLERFLPQDPNLRQRVILHQEVQELMFQRRVEGNRDELMQRLNNLVQRLGQFAGPAPLGQAPPQPPPLPAPIPVQGPAPPPPPPLPAPIPVQGRAPGLIVPQIFHAAQAALQPPIAH